MTFSICPTTLEARGSSSDPSVIHRNQLERTTFPTLLKIFHCLVWLKKLKLFLNKSGSVIDQAQFPFQRSCFSLFLNCWRPNSFSSFLAVDPLVHFSAFNAYALLFFLEDVTAVSITTDGLVIAYLINLLWKLSPNLFPRFPEPPSPLWL